MDNRDKDIMGKMLEAFSKYGHSWIFFSNNEDDNEDDVEGGSTDNEES